MAFSMIKLELHNDQDLIRISISQPVPDSHKQLAQWTDRIYISIQCTPFKCMGSGLPRRYAHKRSMQIGGVQWTSPSAVGRRLHWTSTHSARVSPIENALWHFLQHSQTLITFQCSLCPTENVCFKAQFKQLTVTSTALATARQHSCWSGSHVSYSVQ